MFNKGNNSFGALLCEAETLQRDYHKARGRLNGILMQLGNMMLNAMGEDILKQVDALRSEAEDCQFEMRYAKGRLDEVKTLMHNAVDSLTLGD